MPADFGPYEILREIGRGGMGIVYQAVDHKHNRMVAIKQLVLENIDPTKHQEFQDRFRREAAMAARLDHCNIVSVYDVEAGAENNYYVMEFLEGRSLRQELEKRGGRMSPQEYLNIIKPVSEGLSYAHSLNVVHRDVKPDNIFILEDGQVKMTDFGIARTVDYEQTHLTKTGVMLGTLAYVSPEQLQDAKNVDHRADLFSLAVVSYEALSGRLPFTGEGIAATVIKILASEAEPLHLLSPDINAETAAVISRALRKKARDRFPSVIDFAQEYEKSLSGCSVSVPKVAETPSPASTKQPISTLTPAVRITGSPTPASYYLVKPLATLGQAGEGNGCFQEPSVVCCRSGRIVVADSVLRRVQIFAADGRFLSTLTADPTAKNSRTTGGSLTTPSGIAIDSKGRIYVSDSGDHYIRIFDGQGRFLKECLNSPGRQGGIQGIACDSTGLLYLSDSDNACLQVLQPEMGTWLRRLGSPSTADGGLKLPSGLAIDQNNQLYVVDYGNSKIAVFSRTGVLVRAFGGKGNANGLFNIPRGIAVDKHNRIFVADSLNHRIQIFGPAGDWLYAFGGRGKENGQFLGPAGLSIDLETNRLYVADRGNKRIQIFELVDN